MYKANQCKFGKSDFFSKSNDRKWLEKFWNKNMNFFHSRSFSIIKLQTRYSNFENYFGIYPEQQKIHLNLLDFCFLTFSTKIKRIVEPSSFLKNRSTLYENKTKKC